jgi:hypothetical protein
LLCQLADVKLQVCGEAMLVGADETDPGTMDWSATATISVWPGDEEPDPPWLSTPNLALSTTDLSDGTRELVILEADGLIVDLASVEDVVDALDARSASPRCSAIPGRSACWT